MVGEKPVDAWGVAAAIVACLPLVLRSRLPFVVMGPLITAGIILLLTQIEPKNTLVLIPAVALVELALRSSRRHNVWVAVGLVPCVVLGVAPFADDFGDFANAVSRNLLLLLARAGGRRHLPRAARVDRAGDAAAARRGAAGDRPRRARRRRPRDGRHQRAGGRGRAPDRPRPGAGALRAARDQGHERRGADRPARDARACCAATTPRRRARRRASATSTSSAAGLRAAGVDVRFEVGDVGDVPAAVHAAGYRIVQEALTNVLRHARRLARAA